MSLTSGANATISTLTFVHNWTDESGSRRTETSRGVNLPETLEIKSEIKPNKTLGLNVRETAIVVTVYVQGTDGIVPITGLLKLTVPVDAAVSSAQALSPITRINGIIDPTSPNLDAATDIFINGVK